MTHAPSRRQAALLNVLASYATTAFGIITGLLLVPLYLRYFSMGTYGAWLASGGVVAMLNIVDGGLTQVIGQRMGHRIGAQDLPGAAKVAGTGWVLIGAACMLLMLVGFGLSTWVPRWIHAEPADIPQLRTGFLLATGGAAASLLQLNFAVFAQAWQRTAILGLANIAALLIGVATTVVALFAGLGVSALGLGLLLRGVTSLLLVTVYVRQLWHRQSVPAPRFDTSEARAQLVLTAPILVGRTGAMVLVNSEPAIVAAFINPEAAAVLALTGKAFGVCQMLINPIAGGAYLGLAHLAASVSRARVQAVIGELCALSATLTAGAMGLALALNGHFVRLWVGPQAYGGLRLSSFMCLAAVVLTRLNLLGTVLPALGIIGKPAIGGLFELAARPLLLYLTLPRLGILGVPVTALLAMAMVNAWLLPQLLGHWLGATRRAMARLALTGAPTIVVLLLAGWATAYALPWALPSVDTWGKFVGLVGVGGAMFGALLLAVNPLARQVSGRVGNIVGERLGFGRVI